MKKIILFVLYWLVTHFEVEFIYWLKARYLYKQKTGKTLDYKNPKTLSEKLMWLVRYWRHPLKTICADKYKVREYLKEKGLEHLLIPLIGTYKDANDIHLAELPERFVLKCNHASGYNQIVTDKSLIDEASLRQKFQIWLNSDYSKRWCELHYQGIDRLVVCEELISDIAPTEYQCWCINGEPDSLLVCRKNHDGTYDAYSYSCAYEQLFERIGEETDCLFQKPKNLDKILAYARVLAHDFPFVRTDFYEVGERVYFAEMTFTPAGCFLEKYNEKFQLRLGERLVLPEKYV